MLVDEVIENALPFPPVDDKPGVTQFAKLLRDVRLRAIKNSGQVADTLVLAAQLQQKTQPDGMR